MVKSFPTDKFMIYAFWRMTNSLKYCSTAKLYEFSRLEFVANMTGKSNPFYGRNHSNESINKIKDARQKQVLSEKQIAVLRANNLGKKFSNEHKRKISKSLSGKKKTESHKMNLRVPKKKGKVGWVPVFDAQENKKTSIPREEYYQNKGRYFTSRTKVYQAL